MRRCREKWPRSQGLVHEFQPAHRFPMRSDDGSRRNDGTVYPGVAKKKFSFRFWDLGSGILVIFKPWAILPPPHPVTIESIFFHVSKPSRIPGLVPFSRVDPLLHATWRRSYRKISRAHDLGLCRDFEHAGVGTRHACRRTCSHSS